MESTGCGYFAAQSVEDESDRRLGNRIFRVPASEGTSEPVEAVRGLYVAEALDSRSWLVATGRRPPRLMQVDSNDTREFLPAIAIPSGFAAARLGIYYLAPPASDGRSEIRYCDFLTRQSRTVVTLDREDSTVMQVENFR
ncbi:MAG: hypothetical protein SGI92_26000 [Bryobacteraceae bacterium]|nr:hypothetical protein [Bryobacteraceae bacterium]